MQPLPASAKGRSRKGGPPSRPKPSAQLIRATRSLYLRFTLSYRDVEELLAERGLDISYETVRCWVLKFGPMIA